MTVSILPVKSEKRLYFQVFSTENSTARKISHMQVTVLHVRAAVHIAQCVHRSISA